MKKNGRSKATPPPASGRMPVFGQAGDGVKLKFVKRVSPKRLRQIMDIYAENGWRKKGEGEKLYAKIIKNSFLYFTAEKSGRIIGVAKAMSDGTNDAYIQDFAVKKEFRGKGTGGKLLRAMVAGLRSRGIRWIGLIAENNSEKFYEKAGFKTMKSAVPMLLETCSKN